MQPWQQNVYVKQRLAECKYDAEIDAVHNVNRWIDTNISVKVDVGEMWIK